MRFILLFLSFAISADLSENIDKHKAKYDKLALDMWELAEMGYLETESSKLMQDVLKEAGFTIESGVAGIPTAFIAEYSQGGPVIGILANTTPYQAYHKTIHLIEKVCGDAGHACGHHLFGAASTHAAVALRYWLERTNTPGTIRLYGTPAEEG